MRICACCGGYAPSKKQWWNQDNGYSICAKCFVFVSEREGKEQAESSYGKPGIHHTINSKTEAS